METKIQKRRNSQGMRLSKTIPDAPRMAVNDSIFIDVREYENTLHSTDKYRTLDDLFTDFHGNYHPSETNTGADVGLELFY